MTTIPAIENDTMSRQEIHSKNCNTIWICYRCNLTFHKESIVLLHNKISKHSARKIEFSQTKHGGANVVDR